MDGLVLTSGQSGTWGFELMGDTFGGELDGFTLDLEICDELSADFL